MILLLRRPSLCSVFRLLAWTAYGANCEHSSPLPLPARLSQIFSAGSVA